MLHNIKSTPLCIAILSVFVKQLEEGEKQKIIDKIIKKLLIFQMLI